MNSQNKKEPISKVDTAWLRMEQPDNLMMITGVIIMDDEFNFKAFLKTVKNRFLQFSRFQQKAVDGPSGAFWEFDEDFDIDAHVRRVALPGNADREELEDLVAELASTPLLHSRPLWQFHVVENYQGGVALVVRIHHCIADGIALVQVFLSLTDPTPEPRPSARDPLVWRQKQAAQSPIFQRLLEPAKDGFDLAVDLGQKAVDQGLKVLGDPAIASNVALQAGEIATEFGQALALPNDPPTVFKGKLGTRKQVAWAEPIPLKEVKAVSKAFGCTVNDVLIASVSGAIRSYMLERTSEDDIPDIRATVPVNLRPLEHALELGNHFGLVFLPMPLSEENPLQRLYTVNARMNQLKASKQAAMTFGFLAALGMAPSKLQKPVLDILSQKASAVLTNVPGPGAPLFLAGSEMQEMMFWVPQNGTIGIGISILSYNEKVFFGFISDRKLVSEPSEIIKRFHPEFEKLLYLASMLPLEGRPDPATAKNLVDRSVLDL